MSLFNFFRKRSLSAADDQPQGETGADKREGQTANNMVREVWLQYREGNSDKVYHLMLRREMDGLYTVNFEFGRRGAALQSGTKTDQNVALEAAEKIFDTLEKEKTKKGYQPWSGPEQAPRRSYARKNPAARKKTILEHLALAAKDPALQAARNWSLSRVIWRAGTLCLPEALPHLAQILNQHSNPQIKSSNTQLKSSNPRILNAHPIIPHSSSLIPDDSSSLIPNSILWAITRCATTADESLKTAVQPALRELASTTRMDAMLYRTICAVFPAPMRAVWREPLMQQLPPSFLHQVQQGQANALLLTLRDYLENRPKSRFDFAETLYALLPDAPFARPAVLYFAEHAPFKPGTFKVLRHLYKLSEMTLDAELFGLLAKRFAATPANFTSVPKGQKVFYANQSGTIERLDPAVELKSPESRLAYSSKTRRWFVRHGLSTLLGTLDLDDHTFVKMATGILLAFDDQRDKTAEDTLTRFLYSENTGRWTGKKTIYPQYSEYPAFFYLLNGANTHFRLAKQGTRWAIPAEKYAPDSNRFQEPHGERWDACPQAYVHLMAESNCAVVQDFALRRFRAHPQKDALEARFDTALLLKMVERPYFSTALMAFKILERRFVGNVPDGAVLLPLLDNPHDLLRQEAHAIMRQHLSVFIRDGQFVFQLLNHASPDIRRETRAAMANIAEVLTEVQQQALLGRLITALLVSPFPEEIAAAIQGWSERYWPQLGPALIEQLLRHPAEAVVAFGAVLMEKRPNTPDYLPNTLLGWMLDADQSTLRDAAIRAVEASDLEALLVRQPLLAERLGHRDPAVGQMARDQMLRLRGTSPDFDDQLLAHCLRGLMRKAAAEHVHASLRMFVETHLEPALAALDRKTVFRLLNADQKEANMLAARLIERYVEAESLSVRNIVRLGEHEVLSVRQVCQRMFEANPARMRYESEDALRLLNTPWEDTRHFAFEYFQRHFGERDWTPERLLTICDSHLPDVQTYGRTLTQQYLRPEDGPDYLLRLSQHPNPSMQAFAAQYLHDYANDNPEALEKLIPYFQTILSQVNKNRKARDQVLDFLQQQAKRSDAAARLVRPLFQRLSATTVRTDKERYIEILAS